MNDKQAATLGALPWPGAMVAETSNGVVIVAHPDHQPVMIDLEGWAQSIAYAVGGGVKVTVRRGPLFYG